MKTPLVRSIGSKRLILQIAVCIGSLVVALSSHEAAAEDTVPTDVYGRPLVDQLGPIDYRQDGENWLAIHADGSQELAPPFGPEGPVTPPANAVVSGYGLDSYSYIDVGSYPYAVAIGDVTGDGHADVLMTTTSYFDPVNDYSLFLFPQKASGTFGTPLRFPYRVHAGGTGLVLADLDENGVQDVVVGHNSGITVFLADQHGSLRPGVIVYDADAAVLQATDVDRDGHIDIVSLGQTRGGTIFFGDGHGGFPRTLPLATHANGSNDFEAADMNGDGLPDVAVLDGATSPSVNLSVHRNNGAGGFVPPDTYLIDPSLHRGGIGLGDITGDGLNDAVVSRPRNTPTWLWIMTQDGSARLTGPTAFPSYDIPEPVVVADLNRDGRKDVAVLHGGWNRVGVYLQGPDGLLSAEALYPIPYASHYPPQALAVGDFTSDGCPDVAIADYNSGLVVLHGHGCEPHCTTEPCDDLNPCTDDSCDLVIGCVHTNNTNPCDDGNACTTNDTCGGGDCHGGGSNTCAGTLGMFTDTTGVVVFDADTDTSLTKIRIYSPKDCSVDAGQMLGFFTDGQSNVWLIDLTKTPPRLATGVNPIRISNSGGDTTISPDQRYLLVCDGERGHPLSIVDIALRREIGIVPIDNSCSSLEACTDGSVIVTSVYENRTVRRFTIDGTGHLTDSGEQLTTPFYGPANSLCAPNSRTGIYLARETMGSFAIPGTVPIDSRNLSNYTFSGALNRSGNRLFLRTINQVMAYAYDETTGALGSAPIFSFYPNVNSGGYPGADEIAVHPDGTKFYTLGSAPLIKMNVYSTTAGQQLASIPAEGYPSAVCFRSMECIPEGPLQCADGDACTADACDALGQCTHVPAVCDDDSVCTVDSCDSMTGCVFAPIVCEDDNVCTTDGCDRVTGCLHANNTAPCDDGNACTSNDTCEGGRCQPGAPTHCDDADCCTIDSCELATGCQHAATAAAPVFTTQPSLGNTILWPPNHGYADFTVASTGAVASSACGIASIQFASCSSSQPENAVDTGDGNSTRDCVFEPSALHVRAERDGACSPIGRVYETTLVAVDVCGNTETSNPFDVGVWHDRGHAPAGTTIIHASGGTNDTRFGTNGTYGIDCGGGNSNVNGTSQDASDADPEMEIAQQAAVDINDLHLGKESSGSVELTWAAPVQIGQVTRFHVWRLDPVTLFWMQVAEVSKQTTSYRDPTLNDGSNWQYEVTAVIK